MPAPEHRARARVPGRGLRAASALLAAFLAHGVSPGEGSACDRARSPLDDAAVAVAVADAVVVVDVTAVGGGAATVVVASTLKGGAKKGDTLVVKGLLSPAEAMARGRCGVVAVDAGKRYIVTLWEPIPGSTKHDLVEPGSSAIAHTAAAQAEIEAAIRKQHPTSPWQVSAPSVQTRLAVDPDAQAGEVDLFVLVRNAGKAAVEYTYKSWPPAEHSRCSLRIHDAAKRPVDAKDVPIPRQEIVAYFSRPGRGWKTKIEPGASWTIQLRRVTTAAPGWGYKEELGFKYYPVTTHGPHTVAADCMNFFGPGSQIVTSAVTVSL